MNATETIFALALASNCQPAQHFRTALHSISSWGETHFSSIYVIPCRDGIGADYWNAACLVRCQQSVEQVIHALKQMELDSGRIRPSHQISLDVDLVAWGQDLSTMQFNPKKLPLALDVKIPMQDIWTHAAFQYDPKLIYPQVALDLSA